MWLASGGRASAPPSSTVMVGEVMPPVVARVAEAMAVAGGLWSSPGSDIVASSARLCVSCKAGTMEKRGKGELTFLGE